MKHKYNPLATSPYPNDALTARGNATAPGAGTDIVTLAAPAAGRYLIEALVTFATGTLAAVEDSNWVLRFNNANFTQLSVGRTVGVQFRFCFAATLNGTNPVTLRANAAGSAGVVYNGQLIAHRIE